MELTDQRVIVQYISLAIVLALWDNIAVPEVKVELPYGDCGPLEVV